MIPGRIFKIFVKFWAVLGAPVASAEYVQSQLEQKSAEQETLFQRIPLVRRLFWQPTGQVGPIAFT